MVHRGLFVCTALYVMAIAFVGVTITASLFVFHVAVMPLVFKYSKTFRRNLVFANCIQWPLCVDFEDPEESGIVGGRNLNLQYQSKVDKCPVTIGMWHILPKSTYLRLEDKLETAGKEERSQIMDDEFGDPYRPIVMYCHGNSNSRAASHRIELYRLLQAMDYHVITFDYRGYGDSTNIRPSEDGVVEDALAVYEWIQNSIDNRAGYQNGKPPVFIWGHSLGTGISSHLVGNLDELCSLLKRPQTLPQPNGLILEAPFNNLADEVAHHPLSKLVTWLPYYQCTFVEPFSDAPEHTFRSDTHLKRTNSLPILILHAQDDGIVPLEVGRKLYKSLLEHRTRNDALVIFQEFSKSEHLGHKWVCRAKGIDKVVGDFISTHFKRWPG